MKFTIANKPVTVTAQDAIGKGGEADVYDLHDGTVLKVFKGPKDPDYAQDPNAQEGARRRLVEQQDKLPAFPSGLPSSVVAPQGLARNGTQKIAGYTMQYLQGCEVLLRYGDRRYREQGGIPPGDVLDVFDNLAAAVKAVHTRSVVIGDFNDLNVLVDDNKDTFLIDADSFQYGGFDCHTFTPRFLDPLISAPGRLEMITHPSDLTDWYAFAVMLFQSLLYVGPYGGVHRPKLGARLQHDQRVLQRITVFRSTDVIYPKPAIPYGYLPDEVLDYFHGVFERDERKIFDTDLLRKIEWTKCSNCGTVHARRVCPACATSVKKEPVVVRGSVKAQRVFMTEGTILCAVYQDKLRYLYHDGLNFTREDGAYVASGGRLDPGLRYRISGKTTLIGRRNRVRILPNVAAAVSDVDSYGHLPAFDANLSTIFWISPDGQLRSTRSGDLLSAGFIGDVLPGRTLFWVGEKFGFGFYRAGELKRAFIFSERGLNDRVPLRDFRGELVDATCVFSDQRAWFLATLQEKGRLRNHVYVYDAAGVCEGHRIVDQTEDDWLASGIRGRFAAGHSLFVPTAEGIVRVDDDDLEFPAREYRDTAPFVDETSYLLQGDGGIYVVGTNEITLLTIT